jgi:hypothetical protein
MLHWAGPSFSAFCCKHGILTDDSSLHIALRPKISKSATPVPKNVGLLFAALLNGQWQQCIAAILVQAYDERLSTSDLLKKYGRRVCSLIKRRCRMNWSEVKASWEEMSVVIQAHWPKLADEELNNIDGDRNELARALQRRYGFSGQHAETEICEFEKDVRWPGAVK